MLHDNSRSYQIIYWLMISAMVAVCVIITPSNTITDASIIRNWSRVEPVFREFESLESFVEWGQAQPLLLVSGQDFNTITDKNDCDKQAEFLQRRALTSGYLVSQQIVSNNGYVANTYVVNTKGQYHVGLITAIGNAWYYMDSMTHEVVRIQLARD